MQSRLQRRRLLRPRLGPRRRRVRRSWRTSGAGASRLPLACSARGWSPPWRSHLRREWAGAALAAALCNTALCSTHMCSPGQCVCARPARTKPPLFTPQHRINAHTRHLCSLVQGPCGRRGRGRIGRRRRCHGRRRRDHGCGGDHGHRRQRAGGRGHWFCRRSEPRMAAARREPRRARAWGAYAGALRVHGGTASGAGARGPGASQGRGAARGLQLPTQQ